MNNLIQRPWLRNSFTSRFLSQELVHTNILVTHCPLDACRRHTRHFNHPETSLGVLDKLPIELQQEVLLDVDIQTVLSFQRVNQRARDLVNSILEWQKIISEAPNTIRMAVGIRTTSNFTLRQLFSTLCQRNCVYCNLPTIYVDLFDLCRRCCNDRNTPCTSARKHKQRLQVHEIQLIYHQFLDGTRFYVSDLPTFVAIADRRGRSIPAERGVFATIPNPDLFRQGALIKTMLRERVFNDSPEHGDVASVTVAPWLRPKAMAAVHPMICAYCHSCDPLYRVGGGGNVRPMARVYTEEEMDAHMQTEHPTASAYPPF